MTIDLNTEEETTMTRLYKLTDRKHQTKNATQWGENVTHEASGKGNLCGPGWLHAYTDPLLAVLLNPIHASLSDPVLWEAKGKVGKTDHGLKVGCVKLTTLRIIPLPEITTEQRVRFAIFCALEVCQEPAFVKWAENWLSGKDRSKKAAEAAAQAAARAAVRAVRVAAQAAARAAVRAAEGGGKVDLIAFARRAVS